MTWLPTTVPVSVLMSAAIATAFALRVTLSERLIVPLTVAAGDAGTARSATWTALVGPPVMTGTPARFCQVFAPSWTEAKSA